MKFLGNNIGENLDDLGYGNVFHNNTKAKANEIDKISFIKITNLCYA